MLISTSVFLPLLLAAALAVAGLAAPKSRQPLRRRLTRLAPLAVLPAVVLAVFAPEAEVYIDWFLYGITLGVDAINRGLVVISALLYGAALSSISWLRRATEPKPEVLSAFLLVSYTGNIGVYLAADAVVFYLFFAIMSFSAAGLVVHYRSAAAYRATGIYLVMTVISETALLAGLFLTVDAGGMLLVDAPDAVLESSHTGLILTLLLIGFGIKAGTVPLHVWLPLAHPAAPPAASAILSGAMVKAGMIGFLRFFPLQDPAAEFDTTVEIFGWVLLVLSLLGAFAAVAVGVVQQDGKVVLAYSTISQMGFIGALIAAGLINADLAQHTAAAAVLYAVHHGLAKAALFLGVPIIKSYGRGVAGVIVTLGMCGAGLAVAGAPITSGGMGKYVSKESVQGLDVLGIGLEYILPFVATGSTLLLLRFVWVVLHDAREPQDGLDGDLFSWLALCAAGIGVPWLIGAYWSPLGLPEWTDAQTVWDAVWPIGLGLVVGGGLWLAAHYRWIPVRERETELIPAGDLIEVPEHLTDRLLTRGSAQLDRVHHATTRTRTMSVSLFSALARQLRGVIDRIEVSQRPWPVFGTGIALFLAVLILLAVCFAGGTP